MRDAVDPLHPRASPDPRPPRRALRRWYPLLLAALGAGASVAVYDRLPAWIAVHWTLDGQPNGWMPRALGAASGPLLLLILWGVLRLAPRIGSRASSPRRLDDAWETVVAAVLLLVLVTHGITLASALGYRVPVARAVPTLAGVLFVAVGNVMPIVEQSWWFGVRTPWALADERVWARTHRLAGFSMTTAGVAMIVTGVLLPARFGPSVVVAGAVASVIAPAFYSYLTWRRAQAR